MATTHDPLLVVHGLDEADNRPNPFETVRYIALGYCLSRCLHVVAELGVADLLDDRPRSTADLAASANANPDALRRVLRLLAAYGVFELYGETVQHSPASRLLRSDHPHSMRAFARSSGLLPMWRSYEVLEQSVRTGMPATDDVLPGGFFAYFAQHPEAATIFNATMAAKAQGDIAGILAAYDFSGFGLVGDIGGGRGHLLRAVLDATPSAKGVLFDLPYVIAEAETVGLASERLTLQSGDFFRDALPTCDAYVLMEVIHDWGDAEAIAILRAVRQAAPAHAKLLLIELMVPDDPGPAWAKMLDVHMLALLGGRQRTRQEYAALCERSRFALDREIKTPTGISILEARTV